MSRVIDRRDFMRMLGVGGMAIGGSYLLSSCGDGAGEGLEQDNAHVLNLTLTEAAGAIGRGELKAERYASVLLAQANTLNPVLNAVIAHNPDAILQAAQAADRSRAKGELKGRLHGVPLLFKDSINTASYPTTAGTPGLSGNQPATDALVVRALTAEGAIIFGKANLAELSSDGTSNNLYTGAVHNPWGRSLIPGGSSGGNGAATAARIVAGGIGEDTRGSVRVPASMCGIAGLRPTLGTYPGQQPNSGADAQYLNVVPISHSRDTGGPMARTVADVALLHSVITGQPIPKPAELKGLRLGVPAGYYEKLDDGVSVVTSAALDTLQKHQVVLVDVDLREIKSLIGQTLLLPAYETFGDMTAYLAANSPSVTLADLVSQIARPSTKAYWEFILAQAVPFAYYQNALAIRDQMVQIYTQTLQANSLDAIIFPTTIIPAEPISQADSFDGDTVENTDPAGAMATPGLSLPSGLTASGLPVGLELDGLPNSDAKLIAIGLAIEGVLKPLPPPPEVLLV
jgi:mandelamide amidase